MRAKLTAFFVVVALALGAFAVAPSPAAAHDGGAETETRRINDRKCFFLGRDFQYCIETSGVLHTTEAPSGNETYTFNGQICTTITIGGQVYYDACSKLHQHGLTQDGLLQVLHSNSKFEYTLAGEHCTGRGLYQYANGEVRASDVEVNCEPV